MLAIIYSNAFYKFYNVQTVGKTSCNSLSHLLLQYFLMQRHLRRTGQHVLKRFSLFKKKSAVRNKHGDDPNLNLNLSRLDY